MATGFQSPRVVKTSQNTQLTQRSRYELPHRIHTSIVYPTKSSNGSTIIIYGHETGVRVIWRGGRSFKPSQGGKHASSKTNGKENAIISLDSDDEDAPASKQHEQAEFEEEEDEVAPAQPFANILQSLDLYLGAEVSHLAVLPAFATKSNSPHLKGFEGITARIVFVAACSDNYLRLVTLPLTPPSPESKSRPEFRRHPYNSIVGHGSWGESIVRLNGHQKLSDGVSLTLNVANNTKELAKADAKTSVKSEPSIIVASHSREATGLLLVFRVPLGTAVEQLDPYQTIYLSSPASSIAFNPSGSAPRSSSLLVAESTGVCRVYDYNAVSQQSDETQSGSSVGSWLLSLYPAFRKTKGDNNALSASGAYSGYGRKTTVDAKWVSNGQAVIVLFNDGEWAIWDIEGVGPQASQGLLGRGGIKGGSMTEYSLSGYIESASKLRAGTAQPAGSKFAPMTPGTRKSAEPFSVRQQSGSIRGQISVLETSSSTSVSQSDNTITFWFGESFALIPSLSKYWSANRSAGGNPFSGANAGRLIKLDAIDLQGERCSGISLIPRSSGPSAIPDVLILGEHRFTVLSLDKQIKKPQFRSGGRVPLTDSSHSGDLRDIDRALALMDRSAKMDLI